MVLPRRPEKECRVVENNFYFNLYRLDKIVRPRGTIETDTPLCSGQAKAADA